MGSNFGFRKIFKWDEPNMKVLNDTLKVLWDKLLGNVDYKDFSSGAKKIIDSKASQTAVDEVTGKVTTLSTEVAQTQEEILLRATKEDLEEVQAELTVTAEEIRLSVAGKLDADAPSVGVVTGSGVMINSNGVYVEGSEIDLRTSDGDEYVHISEAGVSASSITAPNVTPRYDGPSDLWVNPLYSSTQMEEKPGARFRSLKDALAALSGKFVPYTVNVTVAAGATDYGDAALTGCIAPMGVGIWGESASNRSVINGRVTISRCTGRIDFTYLDVRSAANTDGIFVDGSVTVHVGNCNFSGSGGSAVSTTNGAQVQVYSTSMRGYSYAIYAYLMSTVYSSGNNGNCDIAADCSIVYGSGYQPSSTTTLAPVETRGGLFRDGGCAVNQGSGGTAGVTLNTAEFVLTGSDTYSPKSDDGWDYGENIGPDRASEIYQGWYYGHGKLCGCMWFDNTSIRNTLNGRTIRSATLTLTAFNGEVGRGSSVEVVLAGTTTAYSGHTSSAPGVRTYTDGTLGTAAAKSRTTFTVPNEIVSDLVNGTINGLMLYSNDSGRHKDYDYSKNYHRFYGMDAAADRKPVLTVLYS